MTRRRLNQLIRRAGGKILYFLAYFDHIFTNQKMLIQLPSQISLALDDEVCIYVTYNEPVLSENSTQVLDDVRNLGFKAIHVNNTSKIHKKVAHKEDLYFQRKNLGYDLAAIRDVLDLIDNQPKKLLILNSSVYYLTDGISKLITNATSANLDVVGLTESRQKKHHIQSYFFFSQTDKGVHALRCEYAKMRNWRSKRAAVNFGELRIMENLFVADVNVGALVSYENIVATALKNPELVDKDIYSDLTRGVQLNPTQHLWRVLFYLGIPIVKKSLIRDNPANLEFRPLDYLSAESTFRETSRS
jgi:hypothetical protein